MPYQASRIEVLESAEIVVARQQIAQHRVSNENCPRTSVSDVIAVPVLPSPHVDEDSAAHERTPRVPSGPQSTKQWRHPISVHATVK